MRNELTKTILYFENGVGFGGAVISLRTYLEFADTERFRAILVHSLADTKFSSFPQSVTTIHLPRVTLGDGLVGRLSRKANLDVLRYAFRLVRIAEREKADCIYLNNDLVTNLAGMIAGMILRVPIIQHERDIPAPISRLSTTLSRHAKRILAISTPVRKALEKMAFPPERIRMVPEGLDIESYSPVGKAQLLSVRNELNVAADEKVVVLAGMVMEWKGQSVLIDAAPAVLARHPRTKFLIVGEAPPGGEAFAERLKRRVKELGLTNHVRFTGYRRDIPTLMQLADIVVHASTSPEPFGRVVIEGMVMRKVVVATAIGAPPEIIANGETGYLVPPGNPIALTKAINEILDRPEQAAVIGERAHDEVVRRYSIQRHAMLIESVFEELFWGAPPMLPVAIAA